MIEILSRQKVIRSGRQVLAYADESETIMGEWRIVGHLLWKRLEGRFTGGAWMPLKIMECERSLRRRVAEVEAALAT